MKQIDITELICIQILRLNGLTLAALGQAQVHKPLLLLKKFVPLCALSFNTLLLSLPPGLFIAPVCSAAADA